MKLSGEGLVKKLQATAICLQISKVHILVEFWAVAFVLIESINNIFSNSTISPNFKR